MAGQSVKDLIDQAASKYNVAPTVAETIAYEESAYNPNNIGDNGTSFGVYQLHQGGGQGDGYTAAQLLDPATNVDIGVSHLAAAYHTGVAKGLTGYGLVQYVAANSGHPDQNGNMPASYDAQLRNAYAAVTGGTAVGNSVDNVDNSNSMATGASSFVANNKLWITIVIAALGLVFVMAGFF